MKKYLIVLMIFGLVVGLNSCCKPEDQEKLEKLTLEVTVNSGDAYTPIKDAYLELTVSQGSLTRTHTFLKKGNVSNNVYLYEEIKNLYGFNSKSPLTVIAKAYNSPISIDIRGIEHITSLKTDEYEPAYFFLKADSINTKEINFTLNLLE